MTLVLSEEDRDFLQHYGVKGMKWGVRRSQAELDRAAGRKPSRRERRKARKAELNRPNKDYTEILRRADQEVFGRGGVKRINRRMNKGRSWTAASTIEAGQGFAKLALAGLAADFVIGELMTGGSITKGVGQKLQGKAMGAAQAYAKRRAGRNATERMLGSIANLKFAKKRRGAWVITDL